MNTSKQLPIEHRKDMRSKRPIQLLLCLALFLILVGYSSPAI